MLVLSLFAACDAPPSDSYPSTAILPETTARQIINDILANPAKTTLGLGDREVTDQDLLLLANNNHINSIIIDNSVLSENGLAPLTSMGNLIQLRIRSPLTDTAIPLILNMKSLRYLNLPRADFTDTGIKSLSAHPNIELLRIGSKRLSNKSLESIATMSSLSFLHLIAVPIDDQGLPSLYGMQQLQSLYLDDTAVTDVGLVKLLERLPRLHLHINQNHIDRDPNKHEH
ncbi:MAG: hypothetical protein HOB73_16865 [Planctomycetaceae bacterium]|jgi:hypothetical protein|nr:hypothetical protein [Planctomycetaceae bacterium]